MKNILALSQRYIAELFSAKLPLDFSFHNVEHTLEVVKATIEIAQENGFRPEQLEVVTLAAWFHDSGYTERYINHEESSKGIARTFLQKLNYPSENVDKILFCIDATRFPQNPESLEAKVLADADLYHFTKPDYFNYEQKLRNEFEIYLGKTYSNNEWDETNFGLLQNHKYHTEYGRQVLQQFKEINIERLRIKMVK